VAVAVVIMSILVQIMRQVEPVAVALEQVAQTQQQEQQIRAAVVAVVHHLIHLLHQQIGMVQAADQALLFFQSQPHFILEQQLEAQVFQHLELTQS
jgi:hypothetical protein